jgi:hypothetical protein
MKLPNHTYKQATSPLVEYYATKQSEHSLTVSWISEEKLVFFLLINAASKPLFTVI